MTDRMLHIKMWNAEHPSCKREGMREGVPFLADSPGIQEDVSSLLLDR
jgi:hypothetical protein